MRLPPGFRPDPHAGKDRHAERHDRRGQVLGQVVQTMPAFAPGNAYISFEIIRHNVENVAVRPQNHMEHAGLTEVHIQPQPTFRRGYAAHRPGRVLPFPQHHAGAVNIRAFLRRARPDRDGGCQIHGRQHQQRDPPPKKNGSRVQALSHEPLRTIRRRRSLRMRPRPKERRRTARE